MTDDRTARWLNEERGLLLAGIAGLAVVTVLACSKSDDDDTSADGGVTSSSDSGSSDTEGGAAAGACTSDTATADNTEAVVKATNRLLQALTSAQQSAIKYDKTLANAAQWSNFPVTFVKRNGVMIGDLSSDAQTAAVALAEVAAGGTGATLFDELREADQFLVTDGKQAATDYGRGLYYFSIHGTPSTSAAWMLQIAGHHLAYNYTYNGACTSATPLFDGAEPMDWTDTSGKKHGPVDAQRSAAVALAAAIGSMSAAKLSGTFSDLVNGPAGGGPGGSGGGDTKYPSGLSYPTGTTGRGVLVSSLSAEQQTLAKTAIEAWVKNVADPISSALLAEYESEDALSETYVGYAGSQDLSTQSSYLRIDGPRVWIEASVQGGIVYRNVVHYHTIWRDKIADYGAEYLSQ